MKNQVQNNNVSVYRTIINVLPIFLSLIAVLIYNKYPLVTSDTGSYIRHAFDFQVPADRSPFYGIFVGISSLWQTLYLTTITQTLILSIVLYRFALLLVGNNTKVYIYWAILLLTGSQAPWVTAHIMPDIFTSILLVSTILFLYDKDPSRITTSSYLLLIILSLAVHFSHFVIYPLFITILISLAIAKKKKQKIKRLALLLAISVTCFIGMSGINYVKGFGFTLSSGSHVFMVGKFAEAGILKDYLNEKCENKKYKLCEHIDQIPDKAYNYLWDEQSSPLYKIGGWQNSKEEHQEIINGIFTSPKYFVRFSYVSIQHTFKQLTFINTPSNLPALGEHSSPYRFIKKHLPQELTSYTKSKQSSNTLHIDTFRLFHLMFSILSSLLILLLFAKGKLNHKTKMVYALALLYILCNAFVTATFANVLDRLQLRIWWIIPALNALIFVNLFVNNRKKMATKANNNAIY